MANLPQNTGYIPNNNIKQRYDELMAPVKTQYNNLLSQVGQPKQGPRAPAPPPVNLRNITMGPNTNPPPIGGLLAENIGGATPLGTSGYQTTWQGSTPSDQAVLKNFGGVGQYVSDPTQPGQIIRSGRLAEDDYTWQSLKKSALGGLSNKLYQVDHAIPLWLGGTNNAENLQVLTRPEHARKTKAESVALTLFANKVIDRDEAFYLATTWQNRDLDIVPTPKQNDVEYSEGQTAGQIPLADAIKVRDKWKNDETATPKVTFKDFWREFTSNPFVHGFSKGLTAGAVKDNPNVRIEDGGDQAALIGGQVLGTLLTVTAIGRVFGMAGKAFQANAAVQGALGKAGIAKTATDTLGKITMFSPTAAVTAKSALRGAQMTNFWRWTPPVVLYGQTAETFEEDPARFTRLAEDIVYGGLTGFFAPNLKGAIKTGATVGMVSMVSDTFSGRSENLVQNALANALTIGVLHQVASPQVRREAEALFQNQAITGAHNVLSLYVPSLKGKAIDVNAKNVVPPKYTPEDIDRMEAELADTFLKRARGEGDPISEEGMIQQIEAAENALNILRIQSGGAQADELAVQKIQDFFKTAQQGDLATREKFFGGPISPTAGKIAKTMPEDIQSRPIEFVPSEQFPSGVMRSTGLATGFHPDAEGLGRFFANEKTGNNYKAVALVKRPERAPLIELLAGDKASAYTDDAPGKILQLVGYTRNADGSITATSLGYWPQSSRIGRPGDPQLDPQAINAQPEIKQGKFPAYDAEFNKNNVYDAMDREGVDYLFVGVRKTGYEGDVRGNPNQDFPYVEVELGHNHWLKSIEHQKGAGKIKTTVAEDGADAVLRRATTSTNPDIQAEAIEEYVRNQPASAANSLNLDNPVIQSFDTGGIRQLKTSLSQAEEALSAPDAKTMSAQLQRDFDIRLNEQEAFDLFARRDELNVEDFFNLIESNSSPLMKEVLLSQVKVDINALIRSDEWELAKMFMKMRVAGKQPVATTPPSVAPALEAPATPMAAKAKKTTAVEQPAAEANGLPTVRVEPETTGAVTPLAEKLIDVGVQKGLITPTPQMVAQKEKAAATAKQKALADNVTKNYIASVEIEQGTPKAAELYYTAIDDAVEAGKQALAKQKFRAGKPDSATLYRRALLNIAHNTRPRFPTGPMSKTISKTERLQAAKDVENSLRREALVVYRNAATKENELNFTNNGFKKGDPDYNEVVRLLDALDAEAFGFPRALEMLRKDMVNAELIQLKDRARKAGESFDEAELIKQAQKNGDDEFARIYKILNERIDDTHIKNKGRELLGKTATAELGIKDGLLADPVITTRKGFKFNVEQSKITEKSAEQVISDFVDKPKTLPEGSYMRVMSEAIERGLKAAYGPDWRKNRDLQKRLSESSYENIWEDLLRNSDSEATQPREYMRELGKGQRAKAKDIASAREEEQYQVAEEVRNRVANSRQGVEDPTDDSIFAEPGTLATNADNNPGLGTQISGDEAVDGMTRKERTQLDSKTIPAPAQIDRTMAGFTTALADGRDPTPEHAINDAIQLLFKMAPGKMNSAIANDIVMSLASGLREKNIRLTDTKKPIKKAVSYNSEIQAVNSQANKLLTGSLAKTFRQLIQEKPNLLKMDSVKNADSELAKLKALGNALDKLEPEWQRNEVYTRGKMSGKPITMSKTELKFVDNFRKYIKLREQIDQSKRGKEIMKADDDVMKGSKKNDGQGFVGDMWKKLKGAMSNTITYERPKDPVPTAVDMPLLKAEAPHTLKSYQTLGGQWQGTNYDPMVPNQNRPEATAENLGYGAVAGVKIRPGMAAVPRKPNSDEAMLRLGTVLENPKTGERYLVADLMNRRFDGMNKLDFATENTGDAVDPYYNQIFEGWRVIRQGNGYEDARNFVLSGEWDKLRNATKKK